MLIECSTLPVSTSPLLNDEIPEVMRRELNADRDRDVLVRMRHLAGKKRMRQPDLSDEAMADYLALAENFQNCAQWLNARHGGFNAPSSSGGIWIALAIAAIGFLTAILILSIGSQAGLGVRAKSRVADPIGPLSSWAERIQIYSEVNAYPTGSLQTPLLQHFDRIQPPRRLPVASVELMRCCRLSSHPAAPSEQASRNPFRGQTPVALERQLDFCTANQYRCPNRTAIDNNGYEAVDKR
jgi:hypothetical protein